MTQPIALLLTLALELPAALLLVRLLKWPVPTTRLLGAAAACSLLSHPLAWNGWQLLVPHTSWAGRAAIVELSVWVVEALLYAWLLRLSPKRALLLSGVANGVSFGLGLVIGRALL